MCSERQMQKHSRGGFFWCVFLIFLVAKEHTLWTIIECIEILNQVNDPCRSPSNYRSVTLKNCFLQHFYRIVSSSSVLYLLRIHPNDFPATVKECKPINLCPLKSSTCNSLKLEGDWGTEPTSGQWITEPSSNLALEKLTWMASRKVDFYEIWFSFLTLMNNLNVQMPRTGQGLLEPPLLTSK